MNNSKVNNPTVIILAAGKGTRMNNPLPKVLHKVCGTTLIEHVLSTSKKLKAANIISVISDDMKEVEQLIEKSSTSKIIHQKKRLGTGHAVKIAIPYINSKDNVVILYGDTPLIKEETVSKMLESLKDKDVAICVLGFAAKDPNGYGRLITNNKGNLKKITEHNDATEAERKINLCNSGVMVFKGEYIEKIINKINNKNQKKEYYLTDAIAIARDLGFNSKTIVTDENEVAGINSQKERAHVEKIKQNELRERHLKNGVIMVAPETVYFSEGTEIASGTVIEPNVIFKGKVTVKGASEIRAFSYLEDCEIEEKVTIGPYARIRPGTKIKKNARIGNFVEIKNSEIGKGSKVNHLSYIGDTEMGEDVNVGAGTITCNYDGKNKFKTRIGSGAFIGSNSSLIAPVTIGKDAVIGAGTTLLENAPPKKITINKKELRSFNKKGNK